MKNQVGKKKKRSNYKVQQKHLYPELFAEDLLRNVKRQ